MAYAEYLENARAELLVEHLLAHKGRGDNVTVRYHDMGATKHAASVRVTRKAAKK